jgi:hypothetical protein
MTGSVSIVGAHRGSTDVCSVRAFAVKPRACGAPLCGFGAARPSKQATVPSMHTCDAHHAVSQLCTIAIGEN